MDSKYFESAVVNRGNLSALKSVFLRAGAGEAVKVGFIGGSITQGYLASDFELCYARLTAGWFEKSFPHSEVTYINAGIGATTSQYAAARCERDLLSHDPDVVFIEFSVNDDDSAFFLETCEGLIRQVMTQPTAGGNRRAVVLIHNIKYDDASTAEDVHLKAGRYYELPCISVRSSIYAAIKDGNIKVRDITSDDLHPNDAGHRLLSEVICHFLEKVNEEAQLPEEEYVFPEKALSLNAFETSRVLQNTYENVEMRGFEKDLKEKEYDTDCFRGGFVGKKPGDEIVFKFFGTCAAVQYRRTVRRPAYIAEAVIDGDEENRVILDSNFQDDWGDCLSLTTVLYHGLPVTGQTKERVSPAHYEGSREALERLKDTTAQPGEHELKIRILGKPAELGYAEGKLTTGGPAWLLSEDKKDDSFDLVSILVS